MEKEEIEEMNKEENKNGSDLYVSDYKDSVFTTKRRFQGVLI